MYDNKIIDEPSIIGHRIRQLRKRRGWTLAELAARAGTSAPTVHRYEGGWDRFELATLRRIGAALDARVVVRLVESAQSPPARRGLTPRRVVRALAHLFWDRDLTSEDVRQYPDWVLERVLVFGGRRDVDVARGYFGDAAIAKVLDRRGVDDRTRNYWNTILREDADASQGSRS